MECFLILPLFWHHGCTRVKDDLLKMRNVKKIIQAQFDDNSQPEPCRQNLSLSTMIPRQLILAQNEKKTIIKLRTVALKLRYCNSLNISRIEKKYIIEKFRNSRLISSHICIVA